jgi:hypothetical protein
MLQLHHMQAARQMLGDNHQSSSLQRLQQSNRQNSVRHKVITAAMAYMACHVVPLMKFIDIAHVDCSN